MPESSTGKDVSACRSASTRGGVPTKSRAATLGVVKWYSLAKGYGFIERSGQCEDLFVHHSAVERPEDLMAGDHVSFEVVKGPRGPQAAVVRRVD